MWSMKNKPALLLVDNYDSFTYNLYDYLQQLGAACTVLRNDELSPQLLATLSFDGIVLSPGPKRPEQAGQLMKLLEQAIDKCPILGICLGMQAIGIHFGALLVHAQEPVHGKTSLINHTKTGLFEGLESPTQVMRYHSLLLKDLPSDLKAVAWTKEEELMAVEHTELPVWGVQFHPESILTTFGLDILENWLQTCVLNRSATKVPEPPVEKTITKV